MSGPFEFVTEADVRALLALNGAGDSAYSSGTVTSNIRAASGFLERATNRYFGDRPATTLTLTTEGRAIIPLPGLRTVTSVTLNGATLEADTTYWLLPDALATGVYTGIQFRAILPRTDGPAYLHYSDWFDRNLDSRLWPGNWHGYGATGSLPNDLVIVGDWGYADADLPYDLRNATKALAAFLTLRGQALLSGVRVTPEGNAYDLSQMPLEVQSFVPQWRLGEAVVMVG